MTDHALSRVLHVDDESDIREIARLALEEVGGFAVESCGSGAQAIEKAAGFGPDVILLDVMMPGMSGPEVLEALRGRPDTVGIPVIFMTAKVQAREVEALIELGAIGVIEKPFDPMTMSGQVTEIWGRHVVR
jgi:CheY-like chemotaxis protein